MILIVNKQEIVELRCLVAAEMRRQKLRSSPFDKITDNKIRLFERVFKKLNKRRYRL